MEEAVAAVLSVAVESTLAVVGGLGEDADVDNGKTALDGNTAVGGGGGGSGSSSSSACVHFFRTVLTEGIQRDMPRVLGARGVELVLHPAEIAAGGGGRREGPCPAYERAASKAEDTNDVNHFESVSGGFVGGGGIDCGGLDVSGISLVADDSHKSVSSAFAPLASDLSTAKGEVVVTREVRVGMLGGGGAEAGAEAGGGELLGTIRVVYESLEKVSCGGGGVVGVGGVSRVIGGCFF